MSHNIYKLFKMELHDKIIFILGLILSLFSSGLTLLIPKFIGSSITKSFIKSIYNHIEFLFMALLLFGFWCKINKIVFVIHWDDC